MSRILVLGAGTQGLAIVSSLHRIGHKIILLSRERYNYADVSRYFDKCYHITYIGDKEYLDKINCIIKAESIEAIIPMGDDCARFISKYKAQIDGHAKFKIPDYADFLNGYDKNRLMRLCQEKRYPHPLTIDLTKVSLDSTEVKKFKYPGILKPNMTTGGRGMIEVRSYAELLDKYPNLHGRFGNYHLQQLIAPGGKQEKIQLYIDENKQLVSFSVLQKIRWYPVKGGSSTCAISIKDDKMVAICYQVLKDINWLGFADFDLIENPDTGEMLIMEINPRVPACVKGPISAGIDWGEIIINGYLDNQQKEYEYKTGITLRHLGMDFLWFIQARERFKTSPSWFRMFGKRMFYQDMSDWTDPLPFIVGTFHSIIKFYNPKYRSEKNII